MVIAIDPGPTESAWVLWDGKRVMEKWRGPNQEVLRRLRIKAGAFNLPCVIEMIGHYGQGMPAGKTVFDTCVYIGRFMEAFGACSCSLMMRAEVKMHLCGSMRAKDPHVRQALIDRLGAPGTKAKPGVTHGISKDLWAALGVAVTWFDKYGVAQSEAS